MLMTMSRSFKKDQRQTSQETPPDSGSDSRFNVRCLLSDADWIKSPTSPLDHAFSYLDHPLRLPAPPTRENRRSWDCGKVGLWIIYSVGEEKKDSEKAFRLSESNHILFGPQIRTHFPKPISPFKAPSSLPKSYSILSQAPVESPPQEASSDVLFEIGEAALERELGKFRACSLDSSISFSRPSLSFGSPSTAQIELPEDHACEISHGSNLKTTRIYGGCSLECQSKRPISAQFPSRGFLSFCFCCGKNLEEGKDIYMYRGEKAFCSLECRSREIMIDEELVISKNRAHGNSMDAEQSEELFEAGIAIGV